MMKNLTALLFLCAALLICGSIEARAQGSVTAQSSAITAAKMPAGAERLLPETVPAEFNRAFENLLKQGAGKIAGGDREVLAWLGNYKNAANATKLVGQIQTNFRAAGWQYEPSGRNGEVEVFSLLKEGSPRRVVLGFFVPADEVVVCALMEVVLAGAPVPANVTSTNRASNQTPVSTSSGGTPVVLNVARDAHFVNVMGNETPAAPKFPQLAPKPGKVRGYVKDLSGNPLKGATIGIRSSYFAGQYSGAQGETDANGYYEFVVPKGSAHYYNAGYQLEWGDGIAAIGLHPADGKLESFTTADGAVENFVLLPYGITSRENVSQNPYVSSSYYGGSIRIDYYTREKTDNNIVAGSILEDSIIEITLTPEGKMLDGTAGKTFVIRQPIGFKGNFSIHNIPLGRYRITAQTGGKALKMKEHRKFNPLFGLMPGEALGEASLLFIPGSAKASSVTPNAGGWESVGISLSMP
ncbi:MAG TPA: hypothetical protein VF599_10680 [Pyrinomonadaceae bacterium]|jgi:hypothetical protein